MRLYSHLCLLGDAAGGGTDNVSRTTGMTAWDHNKIGARLRVPQVISLSVR